MSQPKVVQKLARQGDLLFILVNSIPQNAKPQGGNILALGEVTGHSHRAYDESGGEVAVMDIEGDEMLTKVVDTSTKSKSGSWHTKHDEHNPISFANGIWEIRRQREYEPQGFRRVAD